MKIANVAASEIEEHRRFMTECCCCGSILLFDATPETLEEEFCEHAASQGWHSVETADEIIACACPKCIDEIKQNELEA
jgi:hypothetical protein